MEEGDFFKINQNKFWILEIRDESGGKGENPLNEAYVFSSENDATNKFSELVRKEMAERDIDSGDIEEISDKLAGKYNLQEVEIEKEKFNIKAMSWFKLFLSSLAQK